MRIMKTNKFYLACATLAIALAACSEQDDFTQADVVNAAVENADVPVQFDTYMGSARNATRAYLGDPAYTGGPITNGGADGTKKLKDVGFGVFAYHSGTATFGAGGWSTWNPGQNPLASVSKQPNFMYNEKVTWTAAKGWSYDNVKYWPNGIDLANVAGTPSNTATEQAPQYLSFFAYAPYVDVQAAYATDDKPTTPAVTDAMTTGVTSANTYGIVAMSKNSESTDMQLKYAFNAATNGASELNAVDMLWGLRGQLAYSETDNDNNTVTTLGNSYNTDLTKQTVSERVKFLFKHALAKVGGSTNTSTSASGNQICGLKVVVDVDKNSSVAGSGQSAQTDYFASDFTNETTLVTIKSIKIRDKYSYAFETNTSTTEISDFAAAGWFDIMQGEWTRSMASAASPGITYSVEADNQQASVDNATPYSLNLDIMEPKTAYSVDNDEISAGKWNITGTTGVTLEAKNVYADENVPGLLLIPGNNANTLYVTVDYFVRTIDSKLSWDGTGAAGDSRTDLQFTEVEQVITNKVELNGNLLDPNKFYTLVMHLGLTSVKFEAVVADWSGTEDGTYNEGGGENPSGDKTEKSVWLPSNVVADVINETAPATGTKVINLTGLKEGATLTVVSVDGTVVKEISDVSATPVSSGSSTVTITLQNNTGTTKRSTGKVVLTDGEKNVTINLTQDAGALTATLNTAFSSLTSAEFTTATNILTALTDAASNDVLSSATYSTDADWVTITGNQITNIAQNSSSNRTATITVKVADATTTVEITQPTATP